MWGASIAVRLKMNYGKTRIEYLVDFTTKYTSIPASSIVDINTRYSKVRNMQITPLEEVKTSLSLRLDRNLLTRTNCINPNEKQGND